VANVLMLGAGLGGLSTAMLLARDGHQVTVLERDLAVPPPAARAWEAWERRGVNQFHLPHFMLPRWRVQMEREVPEVLDELGAAGGLRINCIGMFPASRRGPLRDGDERFETVTARRPALEAAVAAVAGRTPGVRIRRGVAVTGLLTDPNERTPVPRVRGVLTRGGQTVRADLVVDCGGRRSQLGSWLEAAGARRPVEEREDSGFIYYARHFRSRTGELPAVRSNLIQHYDSVTLLTLPADNGTWSVVFTTSSRDPALRALRDPSRWNAALARYPLVAAWGEGEPITGVDAIAGIEDRHRRLVVDDRPVATGVVAVGDAWACTNPSLGRGAAIGLLHASCLRDILRDVDPGDPEKLARRFDEATTTVVEPLYRMTVGFDRHRLAEIAADVDGTPYVTDDPRWLVGKATFAASLTDPDITRAYLSLASLLVTPDELFATPGLVDRVLQLGAGAPNYPLPGPSRQELLATIAD
jgi:2-polyprenyl-6-methoxyphenol hydroxylase-like FAD-dependent oxidoreductase